ncbi:MAG: aminotransferase class III-fold pyridoxal phosphate-dependent enzyme, partial [Pseudomonadota bacterium]
EAHEGEDEHAFSARLAAELDAMIEAEGPETVAAFIAEPVMGAGGVIVPPAGYFEAIQPVLDKHDVALIDDEVICGFGRTGNWFGAETVGMRPRSVSMAKQMTGGYVPLSAVAMDREMAEAIEEGSGKHPALGHGFTYGGHPLGCAVAVKAIEIYRRRDIVGHVRSIAPDFQARLRRFGDHPLVGEARGVGLVGGLELSPDPAARGAFAAPGKVGKKVMDEMLARGVIVRAIGDTVAFCPPMVIDPDGIAELFEPLEASLDAAYAWARAEGHIA